MNRHVLLLDLKDDPDLIARYEAWHGPGTVPAAVVASIRNAGISAMHIYRTGNRLVMVMETDDRFDPQAKAAADASDPDVIAWERLMDGFQQRLPWSRPDEKWVATSQIFSLDEQV